jgi:hypothetical protein
MAARIRLYRALGRIHAVRIRFYPHSLQCIVVRIRLYQALERICNLNCTEPSEEYMTVRMRLYQTIIRIYGRDY